MNGEIGLGEANGEKSETRAGLLRSRREEEEVEGSRQERRGKAWSVCAAAAGQELKVGGGQPKLGTPSMT